jgi:hypothetical protein
MRLKYLKYDVKNGLRKVKTKTGIILSALTLVIGSGSGLSFALLGTTHASPTPTVVYDSLPDVSQTTNYPSQPFQAQATAEFGDYVHLDGTARTLNTVTVTMSNWALEATPANVAFCETAGACDSSGFNWPITVNIYANTLTNGIPANLLGTKTVTVHIPWRPAGTVCPGDASGYLDSNNVCVHGLAFNASFDLSDLNLTLPNDVIVGFAYNTQTYGANPTNIDGPYNSLNIAIPNGQAVAVGADDSADTVFWNSTYNGRTAGFHISTGQTPNGTVAMQITATAPTTVNLPTSKDACKGSGWKSFTDSNGNLFKNQGQCVSYVASNGKSQH